MNMLQRVCKHGGNVCTDVDLNENICCWFQFRFNCCYSCWHKHLHANVNPGTRAQTNKKSNKQPYSQTYIFDHLCNMITSRNRLKLSLFFNFELFIMFSTRTSGFIFYNFSSRCIVNCSWSSASVYTAFMLVVFNFDAFLALFCKG